MRRWLIGTVALVMMVGPIALHAGSIAATTSPVLERFLARDDRSPVSYRALRRLDARSQHRTRSAWMDVWTELDATNAFRFTVAAEGGSAYIRSKVFLASLEKERQILASGESGRAALTLENYTFEPGKAVEVDLFALPVIPRREDVVLIDGTIFLRPDTGELVRMEGRLAKAPSFWIRKVDIVRTYERIAGVRMPVATEAVASIRLAGSATFRMTYEYQSVNGHDVGAPQPRAAAANSGW